MPAQKILFLDRDGVINVDSGHPHIIKDIEFVDNIFELCRVACDLGYQIIIVTNQAGIAKGYYDEKQFFLVMDWMVGEFRKQDIEILDVQFCPHHREGLGKYKKKCDCRKPEPGMILAASAAHNIDLKNSVIVGDKISDMEAGRRAGIETRILFKAVNDMKKYEIKGVQTFTTLSDIAKYLENKSDIKRK